MISVFTYSDYRAFVRDWLESRKAQNKALTYEQLCNEVGLKSKGFLTQVLQGLSKLPQPKIKPFAHALGLPPDERKYFEMLVAYNQAKNAPQRSALHDRITNSFKAQIKTIELDQFEYYQHWYYSALRSLLGFYAFRGDYSLLARQLYPAISPAQARRGISLLLKLGLVEKRADGGYHPVDRLISSGNVPVNHALIAFQRETMDLAKSALESIPREQRSASTLTLGLSQDGYKAVEDKLKTLRQDIMEIARLDANINSVIQINLHVFPLTPAKGKRRGRPEKKRSEKP